VAIDKSGQWWRGTGAADLEEYLAAYSADNYPVGPIVHAACASCRGDTFTVLVDDDEGVAQRRCHACGDEFWMLDSQEHLDDAEPGEVACPCGCDVFKVAVGFALRDGGDVKWVYVGLWCTADGTLGVYTDWKIDYSPTSGLLTSV
jgi:hypothetical protein